MKKNRDVRRRSFDPVSNEKVEVPVGYTNQPETLQDQFRRFFALNAEEAARNGFESPDEADDFDLDEEEDDLTPYEHDFDHLPPSSEVVQPPPSPVPPVKPPKRSKASKKEVLPPEADDIEADEL